MCGMIIMCGALTNDESRCVSSSDGSVNRLNVGIVIIISNFLTLKIVITSLILKLELYFRLLLMDRIRRTEAQVAPLLTTISLATCSQSVYRVSCVWTVYAISVVLLCISTSVFTLSISRFFRIRLFSRRLL